MSQQRAIGIRETFWAPRFQKMGLYKGFDGVAAVPEKNMKYLPLFEAARKVAFCP